MPTGNETSLDEIDGTSSQEFAFVELHGFPFVELEPGPLVLKVTRKEPLGFPSASTTIRIDAQIGHRYALASDYRDGRAYFWINDLRKNNQVVVAGKKSRPRLKALRDLLHSVAQRVRGAVGLAEGTEIEGQHEAYGELREGVLRVDPS